MTDAIYSMTEAVYYRELRSSLELIALFIVVLVVFLWLRSKEKKNEMRRYAHYRRIVNHNRIQRKYKR